MRAAGTALWIRRAFGPGAQTNKFNGVLLMEVILKEDVAKLGSRGDVIKVAEGYGRNYLLPKKLAIEATPANRAVIEQMKAAAVRRVVREKGDAEKLAELLAGV